MTHFNYTETERAMIYGSYLALNDYEAVAALYHKRGWGIHRITVERIIENFEITGSFQNHPGKGRPTIVDEYAEELIAESLDVQDMGLKDTRSRIQKEIRLQVSKPTVARHANSLGFVYSTIFTDKELSEAQILRRSQYARELAHIDPSLLIFGDESPFYFEWRIMNKRWMLPEKPKRVKEVRSKICLHVYAAISLKGKTALYFLPKEMTWNSDAYIDALEQSLLPFIHKHYRRKPCIYIQDNAACHKSKATSEYLKTHIYSSRSQPPNSPDLNPLEHIWGILKGRVYKNGSFQSKNALIERITEEWEELEEGIIQSTIQKVLNKNVFPLCTS